MPAMRFFHQCGYAVIDHTANSTPVDVRLRDQSYTRLRWLGMICRHASERLPGVGYAKIRAVEVTDGDGLLKCAWRKLEAHEHVLGWRCINMSGELCVYGVLDDGGWPIIVGESMLKGQPRLYVLT